MQFVATQPSPAIEISDKAGEIFKRNYHFCPKEPFWQSVANTSVSKQQALQLRCIGEGNRRP
jgi:hypothetical protein